VVAFVGGVPDIAAAQGWVHGSNVSGGRAAAPAAAGGSSPRAIITVAIRAITGSHY
jgi:hypothetical protein